MSICGKGCKEALPKLDGMFGEPFADFFADTDLAGKQIDSGACDKFRERRRRRRAVLRLWNVSVCRKRLGEAAENPYPLRRQAAKLLTDGIFSGKESSQIRGMLLSEGRRRSLS